MYRAMRLTLSSRARREAPAGHPNPRLQEREIKLLTGEGR